MGKIRVATAVAALLLFACASSDSGTTQPTAAASGKAKRAEPIVSIATLEVNAAQPRSATSVPLIVKVRVENKTGEPVTVDRVEVSSVGVGPYTINSTARDFHFQVKDGHVSTFQVWAQGIPSTEDPTAAANRGVEQSLGGQEGMMIIRAAVDVSTPAGGSHRLNAVQKIQTSLVR